MRSFRFIIHGSELALAEGYSVLAKIDAVMGISPVEASQSAPVGPV
jgi:hypothetical protein